MGSFTKWLSDLFGTAKAEKIENGVSINEEESPLELERMAIQSAVRLIAAAVSQSRFRTFLEGQEIREKESYLWNYAPNKNQNSTQFLQELTETLIYNNETLVIEQAGQLFIAEGFVYHQEGMREGRFTNISINGETVADRPASEALFFRLGNTEIRPLLSGLCHQYEQIIGKAVSSYERANADKGILNIDAVKRGTQDYEKYQKDLLENKFKTFFSAKNSVLPLHAGYTYTPHKREMRNTSELNDVKNMSDEIYNRVGQIFLIPPTLLRGENELSGDAIDRFIRLCLRPICNEIEEEITRKRYGEKAVRCGSYLTVDTSSIEISGIFASAEKLDKIIGCGILSIDEVREKIGERALDTEVSRAHFITKNYGTIGTGKEESDE